MNQTELLERLIVNAVKEGISKALEPIKEELKAVKALNVKILKEQAVVLKEQSNLANTSSTAGTQQTFRQIPRPNQEAVLERRGLTNVVDDATRKQALQSYLAEASQFAGDVMQGGNLPDMDVPIELILKRG